MKKVISSLVDLYEIKWIKVVIIVSLAILSVSLPAIWIWWIMTTQPILYISPILGLHCLVVLIEAIKKNRLTVICGIVCSILLLMDLSCGFEIYILQISGIIMLVFYGVFFIRSMSEFWELVKWKRGIWPDKKYPH